MALLDHKQRTPRHSLGLFASTLAPLLYGLVLAAPHAELGHSLTLLAASVGDGPGSLALPASWLGKLLALVPIGPLPLRVSVASACAFALCSQLLYRNIELLVRALGVTHDALITPLAVGMCLLVFGMPAVMHTSLGPSAFALGAALAMLFLLQLCRLEASFPTYDLRPLGTAALALGLLMAMDLRAAAVLLPAALPTLSRVLHARGFGPLVRALTLLVVTAAAVLAGVAVRSAMQPDALSAAAFASGGSPAELLTLLARAGSAYSWLGVVACLGAVAAWQTPGVRRVAMIWVHACVWPLLTYGLLSSAPAAQHGLGMITYVLPAGAVLAAALPAVLLAPDGHSKSVPSRAQLGAMVFLLLIGAVRAHDSALSQHPQTGAALLETLADLGQHAMPPRALLLLTDPLRAMPLQAASAELAVRPDISVIDIATFEHAPSANRLVDELPDVRPLLRSYLLEGELRSADVESMAMQRPLALAMDPTLPPKLLDTLRPRHLFFEVSGAAARRSEQHELAAAFLEDLSQLQSAARHASHRAEADRLLAMHALSAALYFASVGDRPSAHAAIAHGKAACAPLAAWGLLEAALATEQSEPPSAPIDVSRWTPQHHGEVACDATRTP